jgi:hypothetical protein
MILEKQRKHLNDLVSKHFGQVGERLTTPITKEDVLIAGKITLYTGVLFGLTSLASLVYSAKKAYADQTTNYRPPKDCLELSVEETAEHMFPRTLTSVGVSSCDDQDIEDDLSDPGNPAEPTRTETYPDPVLQYNDVDFDVFQREMHNRIVTVAIAKNFALEQSSSATSEFLFNTWVIFWNEYGGFPFDSYTVVMDYDLTWAGSGFGRGIEVSNNDKENWAHEMYHAWNGNAFRQEEQRTWFMEGVTVYYGIRQSGNSFSDRMNEYFGWYNVGNYHDVQNTSIGDMKMYAPDYDHGLIGF